MTLIELTVVMAVLLALLGIGLYSSGRITDWKLGRLAGETLRSVQAAQRTYLADHPTASVASLTPDLLLPYMPNQPETMPTVESLEGTALTIKVDQFPPVVDGGDGIPYDPSGSTSDGLWDVGE